VANTDSHDLSVLLNQGNGTFGPAATYGAGDVPRSVAVGDLDGINELDIAVANGASDDVSVLLNLCAAEPCPWDCADPADGEVNVVDFLALLAQWHGPGSCDFDGGDVHITDFLIMLAHWGTCP
jgi:hypothetical protein